MKAVVSVHDVTNHAPVPADGQPRATPELQSPTESARLAQLGESIAELASRLHAATYELLVLIREFDACAGWNNGFASCAHWLNWRTGIDLGAAREKVRVARALAHLPALSAAMQRWAISYSKVRAITRVATPENDAQLVDVALAGTAAHVERIVRAWRRADRLAAADLDGGPSTRPGGSLRAGTAGDRYQVVLHVEPAALRTWREAGHAVIEGPVPQRVSAETSQRIACDAALVVMTEAPDGSVLDVGRRTRTIPPAIRRALEARDRRCVFPGCTASRCDAHHIVHWADGGATRLDNLVLLCRFHHGAVHEGGWRLTRRNDGAVIVVRPNGVPLPVVPEAPPWNRDESPLAPTLVRLAATGVSLDSRAGLPAWLGEPLDVPWAIDVLRGCPTQVRVVNG